ncbi:glucosidase family protein [Dysgonomonas reticulitermitis]
MKRTILTIIALITGFCAVHAQQDRWRLADSGGIEWIIDNRLPHNDHLEMSGQQLSVVLRYGVDANGAFHINRSLVFPMLRMQPVTRTQANLLQRFDIDIAKMVTIANMNPEGEKVSKISFDGLLKVESTFDYMAGRKKVEKGLELTRVHYPSTTSTYYLEEYTFKNTGTANVILRLPELHMEYAIPADQTLYGDYLIDADISKSGWFDLEPGESFSFHVVFSARKKADPAFASVNTDAERSARQSLVKEWWSNLVLETPDPVLNRMFAFAKIRGAESIYKTKGGFMHGPGGETYYAAIWANDQAEYINPFFPFLGYEVGNESAINTYRHFARFMNPEYNPIPSSIISEGASIWHGAKDRGDGAMIAYGAARYALARGSKAEAQELWTLIEWCLEYCKRKLTSEGVVASDSDELENRFPAGNANLCTSALYYDALISAAYLACDLGKPNSRIQQYKKEAATLRKAIESHFGYKVEGFDTYRYYDGNDILRSWMCIPLTMGIYDRAEGTIKALFSPRLWTDDGLLTQAGTETFWDRSTLYALRGVFAAGAAEKGLEYLYKYSRRRLLGEHVPYAIEAWPEGSQRHLSAEGGLYCRIYTEGLLGIRPTGLRSFELTPHLPAVWDFMNLKSIRSFGQAFDIDVTRKSGKLEVIVKNQSKTILKKLIKEGETINVKM